MALGAIGMNGTAKGATSVTSLLPALFPNPFEETETFRHDASRHWGRGP
jgi:hypothetical protein